MESKNFLMKKKNGDKWRRTWKKKHAGNMMLDKHNITMIIEYK